MGTATGPANLEADWTANTINLEWYNEDTKLTVPTTSNTCTYDGGITLPSTNPTKTGYTFKGWQLRMPAIQCNLTKQDTSIAGIDYGEKQITYDARITGERNVEKYGLTQPGQWAAEFDYGIIRGIAKCSKKVGNNNTATWNNDSSNWSATESVLTSFGSGQYCWCRIDKYTKDNAECNFQSSNFVYMTTTPSTTNDDWDCVRACSDWCGKYVSKSGTKFSAFRAALYSMTK